MNSLASRWEVVLEKWVNQNSYFKNYSGVRKILNEVEHEAKALGAVCHLIPHETVLNAPHALHVILPGNSSKNSTVVTLISHADTVYPEDSPFQKITWSPDRKTALGPGVIDDKGGILVALLALEKVSQQNNRDVTVQLICMPGEEIGSPGLHQFLTRIGKESSVILGFEPSLGDGSLIHSRRGNRWYEIIMKGPGGHSGRDAGKVLNPLTLLSEKVSALAALSKPELGFSVTPGSFSTNTNGFNSIPAEAIVRIDTRYDTNEMRDTLHAQMLPILEGTEWTLVEDCPAMVLNPESLQLGEKLITLVSSVEGKEITVRKAFGSSDCNFASRPGIPIIDGLGAIGTGLHSAQETLECASILSRAEVISRLILSL